MVLRAAHVQQETLEGRLLSQQFGAVLAGQQRGRPFGGPVVEHGFDQRPILLEGLRRRAAEGLADHTDHAFEGLRAVLQFFGLVGGSVSEDVVGEPLEPFPRAAGWSPCNT